MTGGYTVKFEVLRELIVQIEGERDDLRRRLDNAETERQLEAEEREKNAAEIRFGFPTHDKKPSNEGLNC